MKVSAEVLRRLGACGDAVRRFKKLFGMGEVVVTEALCLAHAGKFDWTWAAENLLSEPAWVKYQRVVGPAEDEYERAVGPALAKYKRADARAWAKYERAIEAARGEYKRGVMSAWAAYERAAASAFGRLAEWSSASKRDTWP